MKKVYSLFVDIDYFICAIVCHMMNTLWFLLDMKPISLNLPDFMLNKFTIPVQIIDLINDQCFAIFSRTILSRAHQFPVLKKEPSPWPGNISFIPFL